jgi:hypothetical protein
MKRFLIFIFLGPLLVRLIAALVVTVCSPITKRVV